MQNEIIFRLKGFCRQDEVATGYVSYCPTLNIYSHGENASDSMEHLTKSVKLYLESCLKIDTLDKVMRSAGFMPAGDFPAGVPMSEIEHEFVAVREKKFDTAFEIEIPFPLLHRASEATIAHV
jgi:hypothetical protein